MTGIEPKAGDVVLVERRGDLADPVAETIQRLTGSPWSHAILALGDDRYVHANPRRQGDVEQLDAAGLDRQLANSRRLGLYRPVAEQLDTSRLAQAAERWMEASMAPGPDTVTFSYGSMLGLAVLKSLEGVPAVVRRRPRMQRFRTALVAALQDGSLRVFCSELVHRVLDEAGLRPAMPARPILSLDGFPTDEPTARAPFEDGVFAWFDGRVREFAEYLHLDEQSIATCREFVGAVRTAYRTGAEVGVLEVANFITPADFAASPSLRRVASRSAGDARWLP